jgi:hypothetical protein
MSKKYLKLEDLLYRGFVALKVRVGNANFVFKNINHFEYDLVTLKSGLKEDPEYLSNFYCNYLFYSIYMIDGINMLTRREEIYSEYFDLFKSFPAIFFKKIFDDIEVLNDETTRCLKLVEPYSYETESRYNWEYKKNTPLNSPTQTGILGTDLLGLNQFQSYWTVLNIREDKKETFESNYSLVKFLASFENSKEVRKIDGLDKARREDEEKRRTKIRMQGTDHEDKVQHINKADDGTEAILEELERQIKGTDKDDHDKAIEEYESSLRKSMLNHMNELRRVREEQKNRVDRISEETRVISPEELAERMKKFRERNTQPVYARFVENSEGDKLMQMSNVTDDDVLNHGDSISTEDYDKLVDDEVFRSFNAGSKYKRKEMVTQEYERQQRTLAEKYGDGNIDFPNLKRDK